MKQLTLTEVEPDGEQCPACGRMFDTEHGVEIHHAKAHDEPLTGKSVNCSGCGEEIHKSPSALEQSQEDFFCSNECQSEHQNTRVVVNCAWCGSEKEITVGRAADHDRHFCGDRCQGSWRSENTSGKNHPQHKDRIPKACEWCDSTFGVVPSDSYRRFCGRDCADAHRSATQSGEDNPNWAGRVKKTCEFCGEVFGVIPSREDTARFCSWECTNDWKSSITGQDHPLWKGGVNWYRAIRSSLGPTGWHTQRKENIADECEMCGEAGRLDLHHIVSIMAGGTNGEYNYLTLCPGCHRSAEDTVRDIVDPILAG